MFGSGYPPLALANLCRTIKHGHGAGLPLVRVFQMQTKSGPGHLRETNVRVAKRLEGGDSLEDAMRSEGNFPEMFIAMTTLAEKTGRIPEVFGHLEEYYTLQHRMNQDLRSQATMPVISFIGAVLVITFTIWVLGILGNSQSNFTGPGAAIAFLVIVSGSVAGLILTYKTMSKTVAKQAGFEAMLLRMPVVGGCAEAVAMGRFCMALRLTLDSSMSLGKSLNLSLRATGNTAYMAQSDLIVKQLAKGTDFAEAVGMNPVFPRDFLEFLTIGEESGQLPEVMAKQAKFYIEETERRMRLMTKTLGWAIYGGVAIFIIIFIFRFAMIYMSALGGAAG